MVSHQRQCVKMVSHQRQCVKMGLFAALSLSVAAVPTVLLQNSADLDVRMPVTGLGTGCDIGGCNTASPRPFASLAMSKQWLELGGRRFDAAVYALHSLLLCSACFALTVLSLRSLPAATRRTSDSSYRTAMASSQGSALL
jgi:hypothetical protein